MRVLVLSLIIASLAPSCLASDQEAISSSPHIVIILVDDMGYGDPGCFNPDSKIPTPHLDRLAREGMRLTDAHAPGSLCHPSRYGLLTGQAPYRVELNWRERACIDPGRMTIASLLGSQGYRTAMVGKWHLGFTPAPYDQPQRGGPLDHGFASFFGIPASTDIPPYYYLRDRRVVQAPTLPIAANNSHSEIWSSIQGAFWREGLIAPEMSLDRVLPELVDEAVALITGHADQGSGNTLLLYLALPAPHTPWLPSEEFRGRGDAGLYGEFVIMVDAMIGRVLDALEQAGMAEETLVLVSSDNGPVWLEKDLERFGHDSAGPWRGMKGDAWEAGHRMPMIVRWPGQVEPGSVSDATVCFTDLLATFAEITGQELPDDAGEDSFSMLPVWQGNHASQPHERAPLVIQGGKHMTIRDGPWKLIDGQGSGGFSDRYTETRQAKLGKDQPPGQLYHLDEDPGETRNLYKNHPMIVQRLKKELRQIVTSGRSRPRETQAE